MSLSADYFDVSSSWGGLSTQAAARPHILLIVCHDLGRHLGCYGVPTVRSPHCDQLAADGVRFTHAFTTSPGCSPSRAALATGRFPHSNGVMGLTHPPFDWNLNDGEQHIAQLLGEAGYSTHLFGFQHVTTNPERLGFDHFHGYDRAVGCHEPGLGITVSAQVASFLRNAPPKSPFYVEVNLFEAHRPYDLGGSVPDEETGVWIPGYLPNDDAAREEMASLHGSVAQADRAIGGMLAALDQAGLRGATLVLVMADHGIAMPRAKCTLYDPGIEIALLLRWPDGNLPAGKVYEQLVSIIDVLPTVLELAGVPVSERVQGQSLAPLLGGERGLPRTALFAEKTYHSYYDPMRAVRTEHFKYIRNFETAFAVEISGDIACGPIYRSHVERYHGSEHVPIELYDLDVDPLEQNNVAGTAEYLEVQHWLDSVLWNWMKQTADPLLDGPIASPSERRTRIEGVAVLSMTSEIIPKGVER